MGRLTQSAVYMLIVEGYLPEILNLERHQDVEYKVTRGSIPRPNLLNKSWEAHVSRGGSLFRRLVLQSVTSKYNTSKQNS